MAKIRTDKIKTVHFSKKDADVVEALANYTGIAFSGHVRLAVKLYLRQNKQLVEEALQANTEGATAA